MLTCDSTKSIMAAGWSTRARVALVSCGCVMLAFAVMVTDTSQFIDASYFLEYPRRILDSDKYYPCRSRNLEWHKQDIAMPEPPHGFDAQAYLENPKTMDVAAFHHIEQSEPKRHANIADIPGRVAVVTVVGRTKSRRYQDENPQPDQLPCALLLQFLSIKELGEVPFGGGKVDYVVIMSDEGTPTERAIFAKFGIQVRVMPMPPEHLYPSPFERGAMMKIHGIALDEYDRVLLLDADMFAMKPIVDNFLIEFKEDFVTSVHTSSPCTGNWIILRPSKKVYDKVLPIANQRRFSPESGWNQSGLFSWPKLRSSQEVNEMCHMLRTPDKSCWVNDVWLRRCLQRQITSWVWMGANEVQGFYPWLYNISGLGTARFLGTGSDFDRYLGQGNPWWAHFQGSSKPWIMRGRVETCPGQLHYPATLWFWHTFFANVSDRYGLPNICPSYLVARKSFVDNVGC